MLCTINNVRVRLYGLLKDLFTPEINEKYSNFKPDCPEQIMFDYSKQTDDFVFELSCHLNDKNYCINLINSVPIEVFFTFFLRYHFMTCYLSEKPQDSPANVPESDSEFFKFIFISAWKFRLKD